MFVFIPVIVAWGTGNFFLFLKICTGVNGLIIVVSYAYFPKLRTRHLLCAFWEEDKRSFLSPLFSNYISGLVVTSANFVLLNPPLCLALLCSNLKGLDLLSIIIRRCLNNHGCQIEKFLRICIQLGLMCTVRHLSIEIEVVLIGRNSLLKKV